MIDSSQSPLVSIIMNCYNGERYLRDAIDSVYQQSYSNLEMIFWDNASTDDSAVIAQSYDERLKYFLASKTTPLGEARNLALKQATGKYIAFLDCDDLYLPDKLEKQVYRMENGNYAMCYGSAIIIDNKGDIVRKFPVKDKCGHIFGDLLNHYEINMQSVMLRHSVMLDGKLNFDINLQYCPDYDLFMEIASRYSIAVLQDYLVKYRILDNSLSKKTIDIASSEIKFTLDKIVDRDPELKQKHNKEFGRAYNKLHYYDAVASIHKCDRIKARQQIRSIVGDKIQYFILYVLLFFPIPNKIILKILGR